MADYEVKKGVLGHKVLYNCPACGVPLTSSFDKAGQHDTCPDCNRQHVIPGSKEKLELEQSAAAIQRQKLEAARGKAAVEAAKKAQPPIPKPAIPLAPTESQPPTFVSPGKPPRPKSKFGDSILDAAFAIARGFSVIVIITCLAVLTLVAVLFLVSYQGYRTIKTPVVTAPTDAEYKRHLTPTAESHTQSDDGTDGGPVASTNPTINFLTKYKISYANSSRIITLIGEVSGKLDPIEETQFLNGLDKFVGQQRNKADAAEWFCEQYRKSCEERESQRRSDEFHNNVTTARLWMLTTLAGGVFGGLISFMVLPLLIRIEANTRNGALVQAALANRT